MSESTKLPTVKVKDEGSDSGYLTINLSRYEADSEAFELWSEPKQAPTAEGGDPTSAEQDSGTKDNPRKSAKRQRRKRS